LSSAAKLSTIAARTNLRDAGVLSGDEEESGRARVRLYRIAPRHHSLTARADAPLLAHPRAAADVPEPVAGTAAGGAQCAEEFGWRGGLEPLGGTAWRQYGSGPNGYRDRPGRAARTHGGAGAERAAAIEAERRAAALRGC